MKVKELIEKLQKVDPEREIICYDADNKQANLVAIQGIEETKNNKLEIKTLKPI